MGYTHYWLLNAFTEADAADYVRALPALFDIVQRHLPLLAYEYDEIDRPPQVGRQGIHLNGRGEDGHETFWFQVPDRPDKKTVSRHLRLPLRDFTKTARKPYDLAVCELLLVLRAQMPHLELDSDGFGACLAEAERDPLSALDGSWPTAITNVKRYGVDVTVGIGNRRPPYCDLHVEPALATKNDGA